MKIIGYIRVSTEKQDLDKQKHLLIEYAQQHSLAVNQFVEVEVSSQKTKKERRIEKLFSIMEPKDILLVVELSRLGRNMLETLNIIEEFTQKGIEIIFVRQPELSTTGTQTKLLLAIYSYFAETEREYISMRTKEGLAAAKAQGKLLGRPKGSKNKKGSVLTPFKEKISQYLDLKIPISSIAKIINNQLDSPVTYNSYKYFIKNDHELKGKLS